MSWARPCFFGVDARRLAGIDIQLGCGRTGEESRVRGLRFVGLTIHDAGGSLN